jgi:predicted secreted protein
MTPALSVAVYFTIWWVVLFAVLPFGVRNAHETEVAHVKGADAGAPARPHLAMKALATTLISGVLFAALYAYAVWMD